MADWNTNDYNWQHQRGRFLKNRKLNTIILLPGALYSRVCSIIYLFSVKYCINSERKKKLRFQSICKSVVKLRIYRGSAKATDSFRDLNLSFNYSCGLLRLRVKSDWSQNTINIPEVILRRSWFYRFHCNKVQAFLSFTHDLVQASLRNLTTKAVSQTNHVCVC